ncbi:MAG: hypothetical protein WC620_03455 [Methanoregula sp.]
MDLLRSLQKLNPGDGWITQTLDRNTIAGYALLEDIYGRNALFIGISDPRSIYQ